MWLLTITMVYFWSENKKWNAYFLTAQALIILLHRKLFWNACILHVLHACMLHEYNTGGTYLTNPKINFKNEKMSNLVPKKLERHLLQIVNFHISRSITKKIWCMTTTAMSKKDACHCITKYQRKRNIQHHGVCYWRYIPQWI